MCQYYLHDIEKKSMKIGLEGGGYVLRGVEEGKQKDQNILNKKIK